MSVEPWVFRPRGTWNRHGCLLFGALGLRPRGNPEPFEEIA
jgi:hypothetical protein